MSLGIVIESATRAQAQEAARILARASEMCKDKMVGFSNLSCKFSLVIMAFFNLEKVLFNKIWQTRVKKSVCIYIYLTFQAKSVRQFRWYIVLYILCYHKSTCMHNLRECSLLFLFLNFDSFCLVNLCFMFRSKQKL